MNPCCGCSLKTGCLIIGILEMILSVLLGLVVVVFGGIAIGAVAGASTDSHVDHTTAGAGLGLTIAIVIVCVIIVAVNFYIGLLLKRAAEQEDAGKCRIWLIVNAILLVFSILGLFGDIANVVFLFFKIFGIIYQVYCMCVVKAFMDELQTAGTTFNTGGYTGNSIGKV